MKKALVLGAGLVSRPLVRYLLDKGFGVTVAECEESKAQKLIDGHANGQAACLDVDEDEALQSFIKEADLVISLLPAPRHPQVARACLDLGKHMVTTSYVSPEMKALDAEARRKGLLLLNEIGVDPGIDHMSALKVIHKEEKAGGKLVGFSSWCGGLPAPEANDNPFGYKFSWSPRGVLVAARNSARYLRDSKKVEVPSQKLFAHPALVELPGLGQFEGYPNRDSTAYMDVYGFNPDNVVSFFRGTLRNQGHCTLYMQLIDLGLLEAEPALNVAGLTHRQLLEKKFGAPLEETIPKKLGVTAQDSPLKALEYIGMLSDKTIPHEKVALLDLMAERMAEDLAYNPGERDMLLMRHDLTFEYRGGQKETITAIMVDYGIPNGDSSMARTVSLPAAIAARMVLEGKIDIRGVTIPIDPKIYTPVLAELENMDITFSETRNPA